MMMTWIDLAAVGWSVEEEGQVEKGLGVELQQSSSLLLSFPLFFSAVSFPRPCLDARHALRTFSQTFSSYRWSSLRSFAAAWGSPEIYERCKSALSVAYGLFIVIV